MGITVHAARFLMESASAGVSFERTLSIGRQSLNVDPRRFLRTLRRRDAAVTEAQASAMLVDGKGFAEPFWSWLGVGELTALDASAYEGAAVLHDMNTPIPAELHAKYSVVFDGGSLEHVFNYPVALRNCMEMVQQGGHLILTTPCNNAMGHGFYQLSPELFFRALSPSNGYAIERVVMYETDPEAPWYAVEDPEVLRRRVEFSNTGPTYLAVCARRTSADVPVFARWPQQSDYTVQWAAGDSPSPAGDRQAASTESAPIYSGGPAASPGLASRMVPRSVRRWLLRLRAAARRPDPSSFTKLDR